jgi:hypothetical protein
LAATGRVAVFVSALVLLAAVGTGFYLSQTVLTSRTGTSPSTESMQTGIVSSTEVTNASLGLRLSLSVNATVIPSEEEIGINASLVNTRTTPNNLTASDGWALEGLTSGGCNYGNATNKLFSPVGLDVFRGTYGMNNISSAGQPIDWWALVECPADGVSVGTQYLPLENITSYSLLPGNDSGTYAGYYVASTSSPPPVCSGGVCVSSPNVTRTYAKGVFPTRMDYQDSISAANRTGLGDYNALGSSLPASYTLVAGDEWGQLTLLHFQVVASNKIPTVGSFLALGGCADSYRSNGTAYAQPCTASELSGAHVFDCASAAASQAGCSVTLVGSGTFQTPMLNGSGQFNSPILNNTLTVWFPYTGGAAQPAGTNCYFQVAHDYTGSPYGHCYALNSTSFVIGT